MTETMPAAGAPSQKFDPFNFPMPNRADLMSLSVINKDKDYMKTTTSKFIATRSSSLNLFTSDIHGAVPKLHGNKQVDPNKQQWNLSNWDIDRSIPRQLHIGLTKNENSLRTNDIKFAQPQCVKFTTSRIGTNPLNPSYNLQGVTYVEPEKLKFIRDQMDIDDIPGTRPLKKKQLDFSTRNIMDIKDIEGTAARQRHAARPGKGSSSQVFNQMDYRDVTHVDFKTTRHTNPLQPVYITRDENKQQVAIGNVAGSAPVILPPARKDTNFVNTSLTTTDIHGCRIGTKGLGNFHTRDRRTFRETNQKNDIIGAQPDSLKKCPQTKRQTHPLDPDYQFPGRNELKNINDAFGEKNIVQQRMIARHSAMQEKNEAAFAASKSTSVLQSAAVQSLGITETKPVPTEPTAKAPSDQAAASKPPSEKPASKPSSEKPAAPAKAPSEKSAAPAKPAESNGSKTAAQKLDSFIQK